MKNNKFKISKMLLKKKAFEFESKYNKLGLSALSIYKVKNFNHLIFLNETKRQFF